MYVQKIKLGNFTLFTRKGKWGWAYKNDELVWPHVILWRLFWQPFLFLSLALACFFIFLQRGSEEAKDFYSANR